MPATVVTQRSEFEAAYIMQIDNMLQLNAHNYRVEVTVQNGLSDSMVIEFGELKQLIHSVLPDKCFLYNADSEEGSAEQAISTQFILYGMPTVKYHGKLSAESLVASIATDLQSALNSEHPGVIVLEVKLRETSSSFATWTRN